MKVKTVLHTACGCLREIEAEISETINVPTSGGGVRSFEFRSRDEFAAHYYEVAPKKATASHPLYVVVAPDRVPMLQTVATKPEIAWRLQFGPQHHAAERDRLELNGWRVEPCAIVLASGL